MTETSSKGVLRSTTVMFLFVGLVGIWMGGCQTQEQKEIKRLIGELQDQDEDSSVRSNAAIALGNIGMRNAVPALKQALQDEDTLWFPSGAYSNMNFIFDNAILHNLKLFTPFWQGDLTHEMILPVEDLYNFFIKSIFKFFICKT